MMSNTSLGCGGLNEMAHINSQGVALLEVWPSWSRCGLVGSVSLGAGFEVSDTQTSLISLPAAC